MTRAAINSPEFPPPLAHRPHVKICGLSRPQDALLALDLGASFLGIIMTAKSARFVDEAAATQLVAEIRSQVKTPPRLIGVFTNESAGEIARLQRELDLFAVQIHAPLTDHAKYLPPSRIIPAVNIRDAADAEALSQLDPAHGAVLADAFVPGAKGGTGKVFDHSLVQAIYPQRRVFLAGGITPDNIASIMAAHRTRHPYALDLSSGVEESPGVKSHDKLRAFFAHFAAAPAH
ncbi:MAG TPA: phosphoribosylanthranilate isomerase [Candidatus Sumerlaeota bacterium]|nr:phosphoribosylanthranilate isomerase [Candidatus Sumerlaeota bacterium]HNM45984.1 phosphoribosylanthranilate isomerase [Candidatus Sumerlaeota bacterium]